MPNHYHLVVECLRDLLSRGLHRVNGVYAEEFNAKYGRSGHLWGDRFALWQVRDERAPCTPPARTSSRTRSAPASASAPRLAVELEPLPLERASTVISGTPASACDTGQPAFASSRRRAEAVLVEPGHAAAHRERDLRDPGAGHEGDRCRRRAAARAALPAFASPPANAIEKHDACAAAISSSGLVFAARLLLRARRPAHVERPEGARADFVDRPRPAHQVAPATSPLPGAPPPLRLLLARFEFGPHANGRARADERGERDSLRRPPAPRRSKPAGVDPVDAAARVELGRDDPVTCRPRPRPS